MSVLALATAGVWAAGAFDTDPERRPQRADDAVPSARAFVDSIGVNVHASFEDTAYLQWPAVTSALAALGIRHVRDGACAGCVEANRRLAGLAAIGVKADLIVGDPGDRTGPLEANLTSVAEQLSGVVDGLEAPNEYDQSADVRWAERLRAYQVRLAGLARSEPRLRGVPIVGPSLVRPASRAELGDLSAALDVGNLHPYTAGRPPGTGLDSELRLARQVSGSKEVWATEAGYHNATGAPPDQTPVSEAAAAAYLPRVFLEHFARGIRRTYTYEMVDELPGAATDPERSYGLLRFDYSRKPAFETLRQLIGLLDDRSGAPRSGPTVRVEGPQALRHLRLVRSDGSLDVVLWSSASRWDVTRRLDLPPVCLKASLGFDAVPAKVTATAVGTVLRTVPVGGRAMQQTVDVCDGPVVVRVTP